MPIYEYQCGGCNSRIELLVRGGEEPVCPQCNGKNLEKQLSVAAAPKSGGQAMPLAQHPNMGAG